jgi:hypothetical protein
LIFVAASWMIGPETRGKDNGMSNCIRNETAYYNKSTTSQ